MSAGRVTVLAVIGTRPEAIKMAPVVHELLRRPAQARVVMCVTGQHREMVDPYLTLFDLHVDHNLGVMEVDQDLAGLTARLLRGIDDVVAVERPDWIVAQGDTTTVLAAALVAFYRRLAFGHVEAGLRTGDLACPFPEELNRRFADLVAAAYFAPTDTARDALLAEGVPAGRVHVTGNTAIDALLSVAARSYDATNGVLAGVVGDEPIVLVTAHRRESFGAPLEDICAAVADLAGTFGQTGLRFVFPVHPNPHVEPTVRRLLAGVPGVVLVPPLDYAALVHLLRRAVLVVTDSGGLQEEAPALGVPVLVLRQRTERPEGLAWGCARLVGTQRAAIVEEASRLLRDEPARRAMVSAGHPYGDGRAAARIVDVLLARAARE